MIDSKEAAKRSESVEMVSQKILAEIEDSIKWASSHGSKHCFANTLGDLPEDMSKKITNMLTEAGYKVTQDFWGFYSVEW